MKKLLLISFICALFTRGQSQSWTQLTDFPVVLVGDYTSFSVNGEIYVLGVNNAMQTNTLLWKYNPATDTWASISQFSGTPRYGMAAFTIGNFVYVGAGTDYVQTFSDFFKYDPSQNSWTPIASLPVGRSQAGTFTIGGKGYVSCGLIGNATVLHDLFQYDTTSNSWTQKAKLPANGRYLVSSFSKGNSGFLGLGYGNNVWYNDFYKYSPSNNSWSVISAFPGSARSGAAAISIGNYGYVLGGNQGMTAFNDCFVYDAVSNSWQTITGFNGNGRSNMAIGTDGNFIYAGLGKSSGGSPTSQDWWKIQVFTGMPEIDSYNDLFTVFPNPANGNISISLPPNLKDAKLTLFNNLSQMIFEKNVQQDLQTIIINDLEAGVYLLQVQNEKFSETKKVIVAN